jgi:phosphate transport system permease protein
MSAASTTPTTELPAVVTTPGPEPEDKPRSLKTVSADDFFATVGSLLGSFALVWLTYYDILPLSGVVGFVICWYFAFLAMYGGVTALSHPWPIVVDRVMRAVFWAAALLVGFVLMTVIVYTVWRGHQALMHLNFYTKPASSAALTAPYSRGGISNVIIGTLEQVAIAVFISVPLGLSTAVFMTEVGGWFARGVRTIVEAMTAVPDLLAGLFVYVWLILEFHWPKDGFAVALALSVTMTPIIARSAEVALRVVPGGLREAGLALGASHWATVRRIVLPTARPGLATALILAIARGIGESAPLLIVSGASTYFNSNPFDKQPQNSLPLYIYEGIRSGQPAYETRAFGAATVLLAMVLLLFIATRLLARQRVGRQ